MAEKKFVKAYCDVSKQYYGMDVEKIGGTWKVVNMIYLSASEAKLASSEVKQDTFYTHDNLIACRGCGGRKVGGCNHARSYVQCGKNMKYNFQCIYCNNFKIDYSIPTELSGYRAGDVIKLSQGQEVKIQLEEGRDLTEILVGVGWDPVSQGNNMDVDSSVIVAGQDGDYEIVYFGDKRHSSGCVVHNGDNLTGIDSDTSSKDDENIDVYLKKVPRKRDKLIFVINIYDCSSRGQTMKNIKNMYIRLCDPKTKRSIIEYQVSSASRNDTALVIGAAYKRGDTWTFKAIGESNREESIHSLASYCATKY